MYKSKYTHIHWLLQHMAGNHRLVAKVAEVLVAAAMLWRSGGSRDEKEEEAQ